jgi:hypothetical protein
VSSPNPDRRSKPVNSPSAKVANPLKKRAAFNRLLTRFDHGRTHFCNLIQRFGKTSTAIQQLSTSIDRTCDRFPGSRTVSQKTRTNSGETSTCSIRLRASLTSGVLVWGELVPLFSRRPGFHRKAVTDFQFRPSNSHQERKNKL